MFFFNHHRAASVLQTLDSPLFVGSHNLDTRLNTFAPIEDGIMHFVVPSLLAFATSVAAAGSALVLNNSTSTFYVWSVSSTIGPRQTVVPGEPDYFHAALRWCLLYEADKHRFLVYGAITS